MKKGFSLFIKCFIVILAAGYAILLFLEFDRYENDEPMIMPIKNTEVHVYSDGEVEINTGLGYKTITYNRGSVQGKEFGTIFLQEKKWGILKWN